MISNMKLRIIPALLIQFIFHLLGESAGVECALLLSSIVGAAVVAHSRGDRPKAEEKEIDVAGSTVNSF